MDPTTHFLNNQNPAVPTAPREAGNFAFSTSALAHSGAIHIEALTGSIDFTAGARAGRYVQLGHGGLQSHGNHDLTSGGLVTTSGLTVRAGQDITMDRAIAVPSNPGTQDPDLDGNTNFIQIGLGGHQTAGRFSGDIVVDAGGSFLMRAGDSQSYAQVGHGGTTDTSTGNNGNNKGGVGAGEAILALTNAHATLSGDISITTRGGNFSMFAGFDSNFSYAMVGHGGSNRVADYTIGGGLAANTERGHHGDIVINSAGTITVAGGPEKGGPAPEIVGNDNFALVGHGGYRSGGDHYGTIDVTAVDDIFVESAKWGFEAFNNTDYNGNETGSRNYAMIGHGGYHSHLHRREDITGTGNALNNRRGYLWNGWGGVGIGNFLNNLNEVTKIDSDITVTSTNGSLTLQGAQEAGDKRPTQEAVDNPSTPTRDYSNESYAMIGHGGIGDTDPDRRPDTDYLVTGDVTVNVQGPINLLGSRVEQSEVEPTINNEAFSQNNFAMIGNGGRAFQSSFSGNISVISGSNVNLIAGTSRHDVARIGHGGYESGITENNGQGLVRGTMEGTISVISLGNLFLQGGNGTNSDFGNKDISANNGIQFNYAQIGHGAAGRRANVSDTSHITVSATNNLTVAGGTGFRDSYAQIGHGALNNARGNYGGTIDVTAGDNIVLTDTSGTLLDDGITTVRGAYAKIGHGDTDRNAAGRGNSSNGTEAWNGDIFVKAGNDLTSTGGMIGHYDDLATSGHIQPNVEASRTGNTFIAVGRDTAAPGAGVLTAIANPNTGLVSRFSSGNNGFQESTELRFYTTDAAGNQIAGGTRVNAGGFAAAPLPGDPSRPDEQIGNEHILTTGANGEPVGTFTPEGLYPRHTFGPYNVYYANAADFPDNSVPTTPPPGSVVPPLVPNFLTFAQQLQLNNLFLSEVAGERDPEETRYLYYTDAFGNVYLVGTALDEVVYETDSDGEYYYTFAEDTLDSLFGNNEPGDIDVIEREAAEELLRRQRSASSTTGGITFYTYHPDTNRYSSLRIFGVPESNLGIIE